MFYQVECSSNVSDNIDFSLLLKDISRGAPASSKATLFISYVDGVR